MARPANVLTTWADVLAGYAAIGSVPSWRLVPLLLATTGLYAGGIVWNDVFDAQQDALERPERAIPSGIVTRRGAALFGTLLLGLGVVAGFGASRQSGFWAVAVALAALLYDGKGKHLALVGPLSMGLCRGLNLMIGVSANVGAAQKLWPLGLVPFFYIAGVTALSRNEVSGGNRGAARMTALWLSSGALVMTLLFARSLPSSIWAFPMLAVLVYRIGPPFRTAMGTLAPGDVRRAIKAGVLSLIVLDAAIAGIFGHPVYSLVILMLYIPAAYLAKLFAVT